MKAIAFAALLLAAPATAAQDLDLLTPGEPAPALADVTWLQGEPVPAWQPGQVYVLDFWATWCGPCKASIPHLDGLADQRAADGVNVIGVAIWPRPSMVPTPDFVKEKGEAMSYRICEDIDGRTAQAFMEPTVSNGIPTAMIIGKTGLIEWVGHPMAGMDDVLDQVVAGTWDTAAAQAAFVKEREAEARAMAIQREFMDARKAGDWAKVADAAGRMFDLDPDMYGNLAFAKYDALLRAGQAETAATWGRSLLETFKENAQGLNGLAWTAVDPRAGRATFDLELARTAADKANALAEGRDFSVLDTLARVHFLQGDPAKARELQQQAIDLAPEEAREELQARLKEYQAADHG